MTAFYLRIFNYIALICRYFNHVRLSSWGNSALYVFFLPIMLGYVLIML